MCYLFLWMGRDILWFSVGIKIINSLFYFPLTLFQRAINWLATQFWLPEVNLCLCQPPGYLYHIAQNWTSTNTQHISVSVTKLLPAYRHSVEIILRITLCPCLMACISIPTSIYGWATLPQTICLAFQHQPKLNGLWWTLLYRQNCLKNKVGQYTFLGVDRGNV